MPAGASAGFLAGMDIATLDRPDLADLLRRLGVRTLGDFAALPAGDVLARFGFDAAYAHRLAAGEDERPLAVRRPPPDLDVTGEYDPPLERVDMAAFAARALAERLHERLAGHGLAATRLGIEAHTAAGEELHRVWRHDGLLDAAALADRVRWQLDGWLTASALRRAGGSAAAPVRPTAGIDRLRLVPDGVVRSRRHAARAVGRARRGRRAGPSGAGPGAGPARAGLGLHRRARRRAGLRRPGPPGALGRRADPRPARRRRAVPAAPASRAARSRRGRGRLPAPAPATVLAEPTPVRCAPPTARLLTVDARLALNGAPATVVLGREAPVEITGWAGPWPVEERWWAPDEATRLVRFQLALADGRALLVACGDGRWRGGGDL